MMKKITLIFSVFASLFLVNNLQAQCITPETTYNNLVTAGGAPCFDGTNCSTADAAFAGFGLYGSEGYTIDNIEAGFEYTFDMCTGTGAGAWIPEITIVADDGTTVDAWNGEAATGSTLTFVDNCTLSWTASQSGTYTIVINELGTSSGDAPAQTGCGATLAVDNGSPLVTCGATNPALCLPVQYDVVLSNPVYPGYIQTTQYSALEALVVDFSDRNNFITSVDVTNNGVDPVDSLYLSYYLLNEAQTEFVEVLDTVFLSPSLAAGASYTHTFEAFDFDTIFLSMAPDELLDLFIFADSSFWNQDFDATEDAINVAMVAPDVSYSAPYSTSFETVDFGASVFIFDHTTWAWKYIDNNADGTSFILGSYTDVVAQDGDMVLLGANAAEDETAQSPELTLTSGTAYSFNIYARTGFGNTGTFSVVLTDKTNSFTTTLGSVTLSANDTVFTNYSYEFLATSSQTDYLVELRKEATGLIVLDNFRLLELDMPTVALTLSGTDEPGIEYCDSTVSVTFTSTGNPSSISLDWGDGTIEDVSGLTSATHQYTSYDSYTIEVSAMNIVGSAIDSTDLDFTALPAPVVNFLPVTNISGNTVIVNIGGGAATIDVTPSCSRLLINWGDGVTDEVTGQSTASHTYPTIEDDSTYTLTVTVISGNTQETATQTVLIAGTPVGINDIDFASSLNIFPNPANGFVNVKFGLNANDNVVLTLVSVDGKIIETRDFSNTKDISTTFNTSSMSNGVYILKVKTDSGVSTEKFVVSHN